MINSKKNIQRISRPKPDTSERLSHYRFDRNERTTLFSDKVFEEILSNLSSYDLVAYGELEPFYIKICNWLNVNRSNILLTSGSDAGIKAVFETFISENDEVLISLPNYAMFSVYSSMFGANEIMDYYSEKDLKLNVDKFIQKITMKTKLVVISNPGHSGTIIKQSEIIKIIETASANNSLIIVDEAYYHYYNESMIEYINKYENLILTRTFSKAFGLASIRIGLLIGSKKIIDELYKVKLVHEITGLASKIGDYMLDNLEIINKHVKDVNKGKSILYNRLNKIGFEVFKSESNFVFFRTPPLIKSKDVVKFLLEKNIFIKGPFNNKPFNDHLRLTVGDEEQMNYFCDLLTDFVIEINK